MQFPDLRQIRAFAAVAETGSFTQAARKLFLTQSAVSHAVRGLEDRLDCRLLDRQGKRSAPTAEGEILLRRCQRAMRELDLAEREIDGLKRWGQARIRIGAPHTLCHYLLPTVLREFRDCFPGCEPMIETGDTAVMLDLLEASRLDLVLGMKMKPGAPVRYVPLFSDRLVFVVAPMHPWARAREPILESIVREQFIVYARATETYRLVEEHFAQQGVQPRPPQALGDMEAIKEMAKVGIGIGVVAPWVARREIDEGSLVPVPIAQPPLCREWGVYSAEGKALTRVEETFVGLAEMVGLDFPQ